MALCLLQLFRQAERGVGQWSGRGSLPPWPDLLALSTIPVLTSRSVRIRSTSGGCPARSSCQMLWFSSRVTSSRSPSNMSSSRGARVASGSSNAGPVNCGNSEDSSSRSGGLQGQAGLEAAPGCIPSTTTTELRNTGVTGDMQKTAYPHLDLPLLPEPSPGATFSGLVTLSPFSNKPGTCQGEQGRMVVIEEPGPITHRTQIWEDAPPGGGEQTKTAAGSNLGIWTECRMGQGGQAKRDQSQRTETGLEPTRGQGLGDRNVRARTGSGSSPWAYPCHCLL